MPKPSVFALGFLFVSGMVVLAQTGVPGNVKPVLERAINAHGNSALEGLKTYREDYVINASVLGIGVYNYRVRAMVDFPGRRGRLEFYQNGKLSGLYQTTPQATQTWNEKEGTKPADPPKPGAPFTFVTPFKAGILGLLAVGKVADETITTSPNLEIQGVKGTAIVRDGKQYEVTYLFGPDGTMNLERSVFTNDKNERFEVTLVYDKFKTVNGIKIPMNAAIFSSQIPGFASARLEVTDVDVNPELKPADFKMP